MKKDRLKILSFTVLPIIFSYILSLLKQGPFFLSLCNFIFLFSIALLMLGGIFFVLQNGMFMTMIYSFKKFYKGVQKLEAFIAHFEHKEYADTVNRYHNPMIRPLLLAGTSLFFFSLIASYLFYNEWLDF